MFVEQDPWDESTATASDEWGAGAPQFDTTDPTEFNAGPVVDPAEADTVDTAILGDLVEPTARPFAPLAVISNASNYLKNQGFAFWGKCFVCA